MNLINVFFNNSEMKKYEKYANKIILIKNKYLKFNDEKLKHTFQEIKKKNTSTQNKKDRNVEIETLALVGAIFERVLGINLYKVQYIGSMIMNDEKIAELKTGEGKTYVAVLSAIINNVKNKKVHIVTANEYLAKRDYNETKKIYDFLNISSSYISSNMNREEKKENYNKDVVYIYSQELAFDYLRSNLEFDINKKYFFDEYFDSVIIDEIDYVLIDEAKTPIVLSTNDEESENKNEIYKQANDFVESIKDRNEMYEINFEKNIATLTDEGIAFAEKYFKIENYSGIPFIEKRHAIHQALQAHFRIIKDDKYIVENGKIILIDTSTGRLAKTKLFTDGLHQALQAKEGLEITPLSKTLGKITYPNLFKLYKSMTGMSGTVKTEELEFIKNYNKDTIAVPTNMPIRRIDKPDYIFATKKQKIDAIIKSVEESYKIGQPVLVGTESITITEEISKRLTDLNIKHNVLNAKNHEMESLIIANAGKEKSVTISTNMAGRGTDIKLEDNVHKLGGLKVIGTYKNDNRRIDNQLRGRSGRQGDIGVSEFYVSLEDDLIKGFAPMELKNIIEKHINTLEKDDAHLPSFSILAKQVEKAQIKKEGKNFDNRLYNSKFDNILNNQRIIIYKERNEVLNCNDIDSITEGIANKAMSLLIERYIEDSSEDRIIDKKNITRFIEEIKEDWDYEIKIKKKDMNIKELKIQLENEFKNIYTQKEITIYDKKNDEYKKMCILFNIDKYWMKHLSDLKNLELLVKFKENPFEEYESDSVELFNTAIENIKIATVFSYLRNLERSIKEDCNAE